MGLKKRCTPVVAEMHKYKDGILDRETKMLVVTAAYILTPSQGMYSIEKDFYTIEYHDKYKMGAFMLCPGSPSNELKDWLKSLSKLDKTSESTCYYFR